MTDFISGKAAVAGDNPGQRELTRELTKTLRIMKLTAIFLFIAALQVAAKGLAQEKITLSMSNASLDKVFERIESQTGFVFIYKNETIRDKKVNIEVTNASLVQTLEICLKGQDLSYKIVGKSVAIKLKQINTSISGGMPPLIDVKGRVVNESGQPVEGVTVKVKGSNKITMTDSNGEFSIVTVEQDAVLIFTHIGLESFELKISGRTELTVSLKSKVSALDELQVIAYGTTTKRLNTGNVASVKSTEIEKQPVSNPLAALEGRVPGLIVSTTTGVPGASFKVQLRGQSSIGISPGSLPPTDPLFIVDGIPYAPGNSVISRLVSAANNPGFVSQGGISALNSINPSDIESIEILKDADATAIYGSRGANGVVIITTKKGKAGKTRITGGYYYGVSKATRTMEMMNTEQYLQMRYEAFANDGITPDQSNAPDLKVWDTTRYVDWQKEVIANSAHMQNAQISISGGNNLTQFLVSGDYHRETTVFPGNFPNSRASAHFSLNHSNSDKRLNLSFLTNFSSNVNMLPTFDMAAYINLPPNFPSLLTEDGKLKWEENGIRYSDLNIPNPYTFLFQKYNSRSNNLISSVLLNYKILPYLAFKTTLGYNLLVSDETSTMPNASLDPQLGVLGSSKFANSSMQSWNVEPQLEYESYISRGKLTFLAGATFNHTGAKGTVTTGTNYTNDLLIGSLSGAGNITATNDNSRYRYQSVFGRLSYNWKNKYLLNVTGRRDGSSRFGPDKQFANFASTGVAWIFTNEKFVTNAFRFLSFGKIRSSYGTTGVEPTQNYQYLDSWVALASTNTYQNIPGLRPSRLYNPDYNWEITRKFEAAIDLGFLNDRILFSLSHYINRSSNQLIKYTLPLQTGFPNVFRNFPAQVKNSGFEFVLATKNIVSKLFSWESSINLTIPKNKLISFPDLELSNYGQWLVVGKSLNTLKGYRYIEVDPSTGIYKYDDLNADGNLNYPNDWVELMNRDPKFYGGFSNTFRYKGVQLDVFLDFRKQIGVNYLANITNYGGPPGFMRNQPTEVLGRWQKAGDGSSIQKFTQDYGAAYDAVFNLNNSNGVYCDASFIRFKNVSLSYNLPNSVLQKIRLDNLRLYLNAQNLFTITNYTGSDPETQNFYRLPPLRTIVAGIQLTL